VSGHSKWSTIKRKKAVTDAKRGKMFTKLIREITVAARDGGGDPSFNPRLRLAVDNAKSGNMPTENITRAIKKGTGEIDGVSYEEMAYEGYGPGGVAIYIETLTDNHNRTVADVRHILTKHGGSLGTTGSVAWQFERKGQIYLRASCYSEATVFEVAIEAGADDIIDEGDDFVVTTEVKVFHQVQEIMKTSGVDYERAELQWIPQNEVKVNGKEAEKLIKLLDALEDSDDVQQVSSNADIDEEILAQVI